MKANSMPVNTDALCYFVLLRERTEAMLTVGVVCSLIFMTQWQGLIKVDLYIESKVIKVNQ